MLSRLARGDRGLPLLLVLVILHAGPVFRTCHRRMTIDQALRAMHRSIGEVDPQVFGTMADEPAKSRSRVGAWNQAPRIGRISARAMFLRAAARSRACAGGGLVARTAALAGANWADSLSRARCRSSVVEHSLGKGEVDSSILSGSTMFFQSFQHLDCLGVAEPKREQMPKRAAKCRHLDTNWTRGNTLFSR
jgi:hypothetical protein